MVRGQHSLRVALPWLDAALGAAAAGGRDIPRAPAAEWLFARGRVDAVLPPSWRAWLLAAVDDGPDLLRRCPAGPCVRALHASGRPIGTWACARPVHLLTAIEHLRLESVSLDIGAEESATLLADINRHFESRGFRLHAPAPSHDWLLECADPIDCSSVEPDDAIGRNLRQLLPGGRDGARVRSLINEIQMLLHEHPVNQHRATQGRPAINTLWLWGFGRIEGSDTARLPTLFSDDAWLCGAWRLNGASPRGLDEFASGRGLDDSEVLFAASRPPGEGLPERETVVAIDHAERRCFEPLLAALRSGAVKRADVLTGGRVITVESSARMKFWRRLRPLEITPS